jgi:CBS domain-containing protein
MKSRAAETSKPTQLTEEDEMVRVGQLMTAEPVAVDRGTSVIEVAKVMRHRRIGSVLVRSRDQLIGIVTEPDIIRKAVVEERPLATIAVEDIMSSPIIGIDERRPITEAADLMQQNQTRHLAVTQRGKIVGMVSVRDLLHPVSIDEF